MTQINSYNGGATLPSDAVAIDKIKSLTLQHNPTGEGQATEVVYNPCSCMSALTVAAR